MSYLDKFLEGYGYFNYLLREVTFQVSPWWHNYFLWLVLVSGIFFGLEILRPWRPDQARFRKDFWLDVFYMFFNFFLFSLIIYNAASNVVVNLFNDGLALININNLVSFKVQSFPLWGHLLLGFIVRDFIQWWVHRLLHKSPFLWEFHKVHHSVEEMGFAAHLRYHWMENVVYRTLEYIPLAMIGIGLSDFFIIHIFTLAWGHYNHSNLKVSSNIIGGAFGILAALFVANVAFGVESLLLLPYALLGGVIGFFILSPVMKYLFNSPEMHIWHHAYHLPKERQTGVNFGLTLAIWDYIFKTSYIPHDGQDIKLGFPGSEDFPKTFIEQNVHGFGLSSDSSEKSH